MHTHHVPPHRLGLFSHSAQNERPPIALPIPDETLISAALARRYSLVSALGVLLVEGARRPADTGVMDGRLDSGVLGISEWRDRCVAVEHQGRDVRHSTALGSRQQTCGELFET